MPALQEHDFDKMAARVVDRFMSGAKLADAATAEAMGGSLTPDHIERLVQAANTMAFLRLMEQQKGQGDGPDMTHEFDPIDARQVVQQIIGQTSTPMTETPGAPDAGAMDPDCQPLPDEHQAPEQALPPIDDDNGGGPFPKGTKQKQDDAKQKQDDDAKPKKAPPAEAKKDVAKEAAFRDRRRAKLAGVIEDACRQADWAFDDAFKVLTTQLKVAHNTPTQDAFEKDAMALHGDVYGALVLNMVRASRGLEPHTASSIATKHAALTDRHLVSDHPALKTFEQLVKIATEAARLQRGAAYLKDRHAAQ